jgi:voltage-gated potassium channel
MARATPRTQDRRAATADAGANADPSSAIHAQRSALLEHIDAVLDGPMVVLSLAWVALLVAELATGALPPALDAAVWIIWALFLLDFLVELWIAPAKRDYLRTHVLAVVSLMLPAFRLVRVLALLRVLRLARLTRSVGLLRVLTSVNRGLTSLRATAAQRGLGYVMAATVLVILVGAAAMASFETVGPSAVSLNPAGASAPTAPPGLEDFPSALWWTASAMTTGAPSAPASVEGRILGWFLSVYGLAIFGYLTATLASHFVGQDRRVPDEQSRPPRLDP